LNNIIITLKLLQKWHCQGTVEVSNEVQDLLLEVRWRGEIVATEQAMHQDPEPTLNLVQPRSVLWHIENALSKDSGYLV